MIAATARPLRVLLASSSSGSQGGGELYLVGLAAGLRALGHEVQVLLASHPRMDNLAELLAPHAKVRRAEFTNTYDRRFRSLGSVVDRGQIARLTSRLTELAPDIVHVNKQNIEDGLDLVLAARRSKLPFLATVHVTRTMRALSAAGGSWRDRVSFSVLRRAACPCLAIAKSCAAELVAESRGAVPAERVYCVPNGVTDVPAGDREAFRRGWNCQPGDVVLGCVARVEAQKHPLFLLRVLAKLPSHVRLVWVGDGRLRDEFLAEAARCGVADRVVLDGWQPDARARLSGFDLFVLPSQYEGLPLAVLEAMAASLPCVASNVDGVSEAIADGETGRLCEFDNTADWLAKLQPLIDDPAERRRLGIAARTRYEQQFSVQAMASGTADVYRQILAQARV